MAIFNGHPSTGALDAREDAIHCTQDRSARLLTAQEWGRVSVSAGTTDVVSAKCPVRGPSGDAFHRVASPRLERCA
ncbi:hypothetical protein [Luteimonas deserti]|uniref:Uncharacterized protein n=1 Tax=Luteimonas deserti TaxID=2752306 RepID=A0A7Z0TWJ6_9GAMM|nr:hypothetical protein [Luteimonas deserti]NYZ63439.1 hypothetical protein [Luteimonas deserti]